MRTISIKAYHQGSQSARLLAEALDCYVLRNHNSRYVDSPNKVVINWGNTGRNWINTINKVENIRTCTNKLSFFKTLNGQFNHPEWTSDQAVASQWALEGSRIVCRALLDSHEGRGVTIAKNPSEVILAPLYTKYVPKRSEWRVHVCGGKDFLVQKKVLKSGVTNANFEVRNTANGFVFQRQNLIVPGDVTCQALAAIGASGLDFGAVDVIWNETRQKAYVLEINTAPGIEGSTVQDYSKALKELINAKYPD